METLPVLPSPSACAVATREKDGVLWGDECAHPLDYPVVRLAFVRISDIQTTVYLWMCEFVHFFGHHHRKEVFSFNKMFRAGAQPGLDSKSAEFEYAVERWAAFD